MTSTARRLAEHPVPVWQIDTENEFKLSANVALSALEDWATAVLIESAPAEGAHSLEFRGVPLARLAGVLRTGIDVAPTDAPIFCTDGVDKAFEYVAVCVLGQSAEVDETVAAALAADQDVPITRQ